MSEIKTDKQALLRAIPPVDRLAGHDALASWRERLPLGLITDAVRRAIDTYRSQLVQGDSPDPDMSVGQLDDRLAALAEAVLREESLPPLRSVINATGILIHTGLGRSPLPQSAVDAISDVAANFAPVELEMQTGARGQRNDVVRDLLKELTGAESAVVVNNNAAATWLALMVVAQGRSAVLSRGELVEIGGSFRMPDVMQAAGVNLVEVGTTNKTRLSDYANAIDEDTAALLKVHPSNYRIEGFTESVAIEEVARLGRERGVAVIDDVGSGALFDYTPWGLGNEPDVRQSVQAGSDLVCFSGDKLLGGPQAGIIVGKQAWIDRVEKHPMMRALRVDKITLAALGATLQLHRDPQLAAREVPVLHMLTTPIDQLQTRGEALRDALLKRGDFAAVELTQAHAYMGGGSNPAQAVRSLALRICATDQSEQELAQALRSHAPRVLPRVADGAVWLDLRTVFPRQDGDLLEAIVAASQARTNEGKSS